MPNLSVNISGYGAVAADSLAVAGAITAASLAATGAVSGASVAASGAVSGASVSASGAVSGASVAASGALTGGTLDVAGAAVLRGDTTQGTTGRISLRSGGLTDLPWRWEADTDNGEYYSGAANRVERVAGGADCFSFRSGLALSYAPLTCTSTLAVSSTTTLTGAATLNGRLISNSGRTETKVATKTANYSATQNDYFIPCDPTSGNITVSLPAASSVASTVLAIRKVVAHANTVTIDPNGAETINGAATLVVADSTCVQILSDGTAWHVLSAT